MKLTSSRYFNVLLILMVFMAAAAIFSGNADATNGYFAHGYSIESKALGGAGVALPQGSLDASVNPALMAFVGKRLDVSLSIFNPNREYTVKGDPTVIDDPYICMSSPCPFGVAKGTVKSDSKYFLVPAFGYSRPLNETTSFGLSIFGNGGMNTDYDRRTFESPYFPSMASKPTGVDLMQLFILPTIAVKVAPKHSLGISPIIAYQRFEARGLQNFGGFSSDPKNLTNEGHDNAFGFGARIGYYGEVLPFLSVGASYQTKVWMKKFDKYSGLFAEQGDFDIPANWTVGVAVKPSPELAFLFDVQKIYYSDVNSVGNPMIPNLFMTQLGTDSGAGFGWRDMTIYKAGVQWKSSDLWTWRAGYSYGKQPIPSRDVMFNILAPGVIEQHATAGFTRTISKTQDLSFSLMHAFSKTVSGPSPLDPNQNIDIKMNQWEATVGYTWKF